MAWHPFIGEKIISSRIDQCPELPSLRSIHDTFKELAHSEKSDNIQIAEVVKRDPSLIPRILNQVNSAYYGLSSAVCSIEEAILYLGLRRIRELIWNSTIIEDCSRQLGFPSDMDWSKLWMHSIATAVVTREIVALSGNRYVGDMDYIAGLVHNIGKIVAAISFCEAFDLLIEYNHRGHEGVHEVCKLEESLMGWNHGRIGGYYLKRHGLPPEIVEAVTYHHEPEKAASDRKLAAAIHLADSMVTSIGIQGIDKVVPIEADLWKDLISWRILFPSERGCFDEIMVSLKSTLNHLKLISVRIV